MRVGVLQGEGNDTRPLLKRFRAEKTDPGSVAQLLEGIADEISFMGEDPVRAHSIQVVDRGAQRCRSGDMRRPGLELVWEGGPGGEVALHETDHLSTTLIGWHSLEEFLLSPEDTDPGGTAHLVSGEGVEVGSQLLHIGGVMGRALGTIDQKKCTSLVYLACDLRDGVDRAEGI
jgi:hypothetical protein